MSPHEPLGADDLHTLVLLYLSVAYESDHNFDPAEQQAVLSLLRWWMPNTKAKEAKRLIETAFNAVRGGMKHDLERLARTLGARLPAELQRRVLTDLGQIARADGYLSFEEASAIRRVRAALDTVEAEPSEKKEDRG